VFYLLQCNHLFQHFIPVATSEEMIPLIPCHHFNAQHVLSLSDEPVVVSGAGSNLFVATSCCSVNHYVITKNASEQCKFVGSFPSVAAVDQMAYSEKGE